MDIRIKIADFSRRLELSADECLAETPSGNLPVPRNFSADSDQTEKILYKFRLFHLHSEAEADGLYRQLSRLTGDDFEIVQPGEKWGGRGIKRWWVVSRGFTAEDEVLDYSRDLNQLLPPELKGRMQVEGGLFCEYPDKPSQIIRISTPDGQIIHSAEILRLVSPTGITVKQAPVGETFHWEHNEDLRFNNIIELRPGKSGVLVINELPVEDYLASVNSSEMSAHAPLEFLKAQTIAARSTVAATKGCHHFGEPFDLCNGDHCQCYYGSSRTQDRSLEASFLTKGSALCHQGIIADTRYAKTCGGVMETFDNAWENFDPAYLRPKFDGVSQDYRLTDADAYISSKPDCWCNPEIHPYPDYFDYARPYFRWDFALGNSELAGLLKAETGIEPGNISEIKVLRRGRSGRITGIKIIGERELILHGELNIRRAFSDSHLPSSCFTIERKDNGFRLKGAGWGHGVGMCQMGALNMSLAGHTAAEILEHYYPETELVKFFNHE